MKDDKKKQIITIIIGVAILLLVTIGASYAYFTSNISSSGDNKIDATTVVLASARMDYGDKVVANGILPGNKILKTINVTGSGPEDAVPITATIILTPDVTDFGTHVKYTIYAVENSVIDASTICESPKPTTENGMYYDAMECDTTELGTSILSGTFEGKKTVTKEIEVTSTTNTTYYLLIEYVNDPNGQDEEQGKVFTINLRFQATYEGPSITQTFIVDGEEVYDLPSKQEYYEVAVTCSDNVERTWNYETWSLNIEDDLGASCSCSLEFKKSLAMALKNCNKDASTCLIENSELEEDDLAYDETVDNNLRYIGANPNNYVLFNNELWRIIGVMNNITDSEGNVGSHIKIIRNESIGNYSFDNNGTGSNDWSKSALMEVLNDGAFYTRTSGDCPSGNYGATTACDFSNIGLTIESKKMISNVIWNLGGSKRSSYASLSYENERGNSVYNGNSTTWTGKIGLMYPSDYGYAVGGNSRTSCLRRTLDEWYKESACYINNWLYISESDQWALTPNSNDSASTLYVNHAGTIYDVASYASLDVRPSLYLDSNVVIESGDGSLSSPYTLKLDN